MRGEYDEPDMNDPELKATVAAMQPNERKSYLDMLAKKKQMSKLADTEM